MGRTNGGTDPLKEKGEEKRKQKKILSSKGEKKRRDRLEFTRGRTGLGGKSMGVSIWDRTGAKQKKKNGSNNRVLVDPAGGGMKKEKGQQGEEALKN